MLETTYSGGAARLQVLPAGEHGFHDVQIAGTNGVNGYNGIQYADGRLVLPASRSGVVRFRVHQGRPKWHAGETGETELTASDVGGFFVDQRRIVVPASNTPTVEIYQYPSGKPIKSLSGFGDPIAAVVSK